MKITFDEKVTEKLQALGAVDLVLDFDNTLSAEQISAGSCDAGLANFRLVAIDKGSLPEIFDASLESDLGPVFYKEWGGRFFNGDMLARVEGSYGLIALKNAGEYLSLNMTIVDLRGKL